MKKNKLNKMERRIHTVSNFESSRMTGKGFKNEPSGTDPTNTTITTLTTVSTLPGLKG